VQASEFAKPSFVVLVAWLFSESARRPEMPATSLALSALLLVVALLVLEPDFGQTPEWLAFERCMQELARAHDNGRTVLASSFGATLEMAREGHIELRQEGPFEPIYMRSRKPDAAQSDAEWQRVV